MRDNQLARRRTWTDLLDPIFFNQCDFKRAQRKTSFMCYSNVREIWPSPREICSNLTFRLADGGRAVKLHTVLIPCSHFRMTFFALFLIHNVHTRLLPSFAAVDYRNGQLLAKLATNDKKRIIYNEKTNVVVQPLRMIMTCQMRYNTGRIEGV